MEVQHHPFLISALAEGDLSSSCCGCFIPKEITPQHPLNKRLGGPQSQFRYFGEG